MAFRESKPSRHLFLSPSGQTLPRWLEAFPRLQCLRTGAPLPAPEALTLVWLRCAAAATASRSAAEC